MAGDVESGTPGSHSVEARTKRLLQVIERRPGCNLAQARRSSGLGRRAFESTIFSLVAAGAVHRVSCGRMVVLFPDRAGMQECIEEIKVLRCPLNRRLHAYLSEHEMVPCRDVVEHAHRAWGWSVRMAHWRLWRLKDAGLVHMTRDLRDGRRVHCQPRPADPRVDEILGD